VGAGDLSGRTGNPRRVMLSSMTVPGLDPARVRRLVLVHTVLQRPPHVPEVRLHLAEDVTDLWQRMERELGRTGTEPPFWASAWAGGQALARHVLTEPDVVAGRSVLDLASGSGLCAIAACLAGAASVAASDIDEFSVAAIRENAEANGVVVQPILGDLLAGDPPDVEVVLAGDVCYERRMATRVLDWLHLCRHRGVEVLLGDPGRAFLPADVLMEVARYDVTGDPILENAGVRDARVYRLR
jgi:predicted nicotinamide N-methyase